MEKRNTSENSHDKYHDRLLCKNYQSHSTYFILEKNWLQTNLHLNL